MSNGNVLLPISLSQHATKHTITDKDIESIDYIYMQVGKIYKVCGHKAKQIDISYLEQLVCNTRVNSNDALYLSDVMSYLIDYYPIFFYDYKNNGVPKCIEINRETNKIIVNGKQYNKLELTPEEVLRPHWYIDYHQFY